MPMARQLRIDNEYLIDNRFVLTVLDDHMLVGEKVNKPFENIYDGVLILKNAKIIDIPLVSGEVYNAEGLYDVAFNIAKFGKCSHIKINTSEIIEYIIINVSDYINLSLTIEAIETIYTQDEIDYKTRVLDDKKELLDKLVIFKNAYGVVFIGELISVDKKFMKMRYARVVNNKPENIEDMKLGSYIKTANFINIMTLRNILEFGVMDSRYSLSPEVEILEFSNYDLQYFTIMTFTDHIADSFIANIDKFVNHA